MENNYTVYMHVAPNGKKYIGITCIKPENRWCCGKGYKHNKHFYNAIKKYDWNNFKHIILYKNLTKEKAEQKEIKLIAKYKSNNRKYGYNIESGGNATKKLSSETKKKISIAHTGKKLPPFTEEHKNNISKGKKGKKLGPMKEEFIKKMSESRKGHIVSETTREKISKANKGTKRSKEQRRKISEGHKGQIPWNKGKHNIYSEETKNKISKALKGIKRKPMSKKLKKQISIRMSKAVLCIETNKIYCNVKEAEKHTGISHYNIQHVCRGEVKLTGGYHWKYYEEEA